MKSVTITLKDESLKSQDVDLIASELSNEGLLISSVQPYGVITGEAEDEDIEKFKQNKDLYVNDNPPFHNISPPDAEIQ